MRMYIHKLIYGLLQSHSLSLSLSELFFVVFKFSEQINTVSTNKYLI
jgi:hypothetical protein